MNQIELQAATSYLLGRAHGGIWAIIDSKLDMIARFTALEELEAELRKAIENLYYLTPVPTSPT